jgi:S-adenosylmethionine synthetase
MARNITIERLDKTPIERQQIEIVERKGIGHPDSLIDGIMENISCELSKYYLHEFGRILHHNVDKGQIVGGEAFPEFGGGRLTRPIYILLTGRATSEVDGRVKVPVGNIALKAAKEYLKKSVRFLDLDFDTVIDTRIARGSIDLLDVFSRGKVPLANDTSFGIGFAPYSETEKISLETERMLNAADYKKKYPAVGEDIKVMALRDGDTIKLTVAIAFVSKFIEHIDDYKKLKESVTQDIISNAKRFTKRNVEVYINTADNYEKACVYITVTGLSCECGDDGSVGRGNRVNGLITPGRPMSLEAAAGKNPVNHVGKMYNVLANEMAHDIVKLYPEIQECHVRLLSQIGKPIDQPKSASIQIVLDDNGKLAAMKEKVNYVVDGWLEDITGITAMIVEGKANVF